MRMTLSLLALTTLMMGLLSATEPEKAKTGKQLLFELRVLNGNPLGSEEDGTIRVKSEHLLTTKENQPLTPIQGIWLEDQWHKTISGEWISPGHVIKCAPGVVEDGTLPLKLELINTTFLRKTENETEYTTHVKFTRKTVKLGEVATYKLSEAGTPSDKQVWMELLVTEVSPLN